MKALPARALLALLLVLGLGRSAIAADARPNVVFILADDWGWGDLGCHSNKQVNTPNIDRLAREGTDFHQFNVGSPVCSPSRVAFTTGRFPARFGVYEAIGGLAKNREVGQVDWLDPKAHTLPRLLQQAGYATGHVGKWHLASGQAADAPQPAAYGVAEHALFKGTAHPQAKVLESHRDVYDAAVKFIRAHKDGPFYLNLWIHETHLPHLPTTESLKENAHLGEPQNVYAAVVADGDKGVGKVLAVLAELGLEQNTIVVFSSDNGPENTQASKEMGGGYGQFYSVGSTGGGRGRKRSLYEGGVRLPLIVRWPGHVPAGKINRSTSLAAVDLLPTICAAAGVTLPTDYQPDGENMLPAWLGADKQRTRPIFWEWRGKDTPRDCWPRFAIRDGDWKLLSDGPKRNELYLAPNDWSEGKNVNRDHPDVMARLSAQLESWKASLPKSAPTEFISKQNRGGADPDGKRKGKRKAK
jgi:arylsulfatase A-like enzyme